MQKKSNKCPKEQVSQPNKIIRVKGSIISTTWVTKLENKKVTRNNTFHPISYHLIRQCVQGGPPVLGHDQFLAYTAASAAGW